MRYCPHSYFTLSNWPLFYAKKGHKWHRRRSITGNIILEHGIMDRVRGHPKSLLVTRTRSI